MDRFLNEDNIIKKNSNIQRALQKANLLKQQTQQKLNQLTPEQLASIWQDEPIQANDFNELSIQDGLKQAQNFIQINSSENQNIQHNNLNQINVTSEINQLKQNDINANTNVNTNGININTDTNINDINTNHMINSILHVAEQSINNANNNQPNQIINNQSNQLINMQQKQDVIFDAANQLKTNNLANFQNNSNNTYFQNDTNKENIINKKSNTNINNEENIINNLNKDIKTLKKEILKTDKIFTPQETLIKKQIQAYNELVNLQVELEIINRMSIRVEEKLRQSYTTKSYNLQIRIREQEVRLGVIADLLSGKS